MRGSVLVLLSALGAATLISLLLWSAPRVIRRRTRTFRDRLGRLAPVPGQKVGPAGGVARLTPLEADGKATPQTSNASGSDNAGPARHPMTPPIKPPSPASSGAAHPARSTSQRITPGTQPPEPPRAPESSKEH